MKCKLCLSEVSSLRRSHIIPECFYKEVYDKKHRFIPITNENLNNLKLEQLGYREKLLCGSCEVKLSKWENNTKKDLVDISKRSSNFLKISPLSSEHILIEDISHDSFKKCMLSILWRMSISSHEMFAKYELGPYEEKLRIVLDQEPLLTTLDYPIFVREVTLSGTHYPDIISCIGKGRMGHHIFQSFIIYGYLIDIVVSSQRMPERYNPQMLSSNNHLLVRQIDHRSLPNDHGLLERFKQDDVANFFKQQAS
ncbi:hypothetical protein MO867_13505 [Microbulbifer sp. OS29]|uniref:HNH endonuclease n=1 Tax=Microbulbifer okhotskensis TaxID=2926617 RepID=A0A9X2EPC9_9GAMM|nr:hypothetical protein [Microbulbifer okhotskensis]MCO1335349.1 hypothetical protein [Microbulbifer okhotskensis]